MAAPPFGSPLWNAAAYALDVASSFYRTIVSFADAPLAHEVRLLQGHDAWPLHACALCHGPAHLRRRSPQEGWMAADGGHADQADAMSRAVASCRAETSGLPAAEDPDGHAATGGDAEVRRLMARDGEVGR